MTEPVSGREGAVERDAVVVLGMHRTGTSALARVLHGCGAQPPRTLMAARPDNPDGFWESSVLVALADEMLGENGLAWDSLGKVDGEWVESATGRRIVARYREALSQEFPGAGPILLKDPRLSRLVPALENAFEGTGVSPRFLVMLRHPWEAARSLELRDAISLERGVALWLEHTLDAERATRDLPRAFVSYEDLLSDWRGVMGRLRESLDLPALRPPSDASSAAALDAAVSPSRRHHDARSASWDIPSPLQSWADDAHEALLGLIDRPDESAFRVLDRIRVELAEVERLVVPISRDLESVTRREREEREAAQIHLAHAEASLEEWKRRAAHRDEVEAWARTLDERARNLERERGELEGHLQAERARLEQVWNSRSMRLTRPLRAAGRAMSRARTRARRAIVSSARAIYHTLPLPEAIRGPIGRRLDRRRREAERRALEAERRAAGAAPAGPGAVDPAVVKERVRRETERALDEFLATEEDLALPDPGNPPRVSVILVLYNQAPLTFACLRALAGSEFRDFEVIVVDNGSTDRTAELLERVDPCRAVFNEENLHFLRGCNQAAELARGRLLLFLNNDTRVAPDAIGRALATLEEEEGAGAIGGRLVLPDGSLQEAGSIIWSDGSCLGYGRGEDPMDPRFAFRRDVDYCSTAFLLTPRELFEELGGFDEGFAPAYYEETDYCLRLQERGRRVIYEPGVVVQHFEFASSNREGAARLSRRNQLRFAEKHRERLRRHPAPDPERALFARSARRDALRVLFVEDRFPHRDLGSGFPRANHLLHEMAGAGCAVTVYATDQLHEPWDRVYRDLPPTVECLRGDREAGFADLLRRRRGYFHTIVLSRPHNMAAFNRVVAEDPRILGGARIVYDAEALFGLREIARRELRGDSPDPDERSAMIAAEVELAGPAHVILTVSEGEARYFEELEGKEVLVLGHALEPAPGQREFEEREGFLFVGAFHDGEDPNSDSMVWFVREVWPILRRDPRLEGGSLRIVGRNPPARVRALEKREGVEVVGEVASLGPYYDEARACVIPTRYAAGVPYKAHEAAARGVPIVATGLIAGQLGWAHERELLVGSESDPRDFAEMCLRLYTDGELWWRLRDGALERIERECSKAGVRASLLRALFPDGRPAGDVGVSTPRTRGDVQRADHTNRAIADH